MCEERLPSQIQFELCGRCVVCCMSDVREHVRRVWSVCERTQVKWNEKRVQKDGIFGVWSVERQYGAPNGHSSRHIHTHSHGRWQKSFSGFRLENSIVVPGECVCTRRALRTVWSRHRSRLKSRYLFFHVIFTLRKILQLLVCVFFTAVSASEKRQIHLQLTKEVSVLFQFNSVSSTASFDATRHRKS